VAVPVEHLGDVALRDSVLGETILRAYLIRRARLIERRAGMRIFGSRYSADTRRLLDFATRNRLPHKWIDLEKESDVEAFLRTMNIDRADTPIVILRCGRLLRNPSNAQLAVELGVLSPPIRTELCDLLVVGAGPAGLAASVHGASDGLSVTAVDAIALGGQASTTSRIENYLGFPGGISGAELTERAVVQARRFGVRLVAPTKVIALAVDDGHFRAELETDEVLHARTVLVATGARYRRLDVPGLARFETASVFYEATVIERQAFSGQPVAVIGGGNSAGQAAVFLADAARTVYLLVRDRNLGAKMSKYLADEVEDDPRITVMTHAEVRELRGDQLFAAVVVEDNETGACTELVVRALFVFIGAEPQSSWLTGVVQLDRYGFVLTGADVDRPSDQPTPHEYRSILQTSQPGIFAAGDVRRGATRRVAAAMGEGAIAVAAVNRYLTSAGHAIHHR
jgi:thioredoxin reductase (NADPH)